ncbi:hypothetical protein [Olivibacter domesticus]|uniref:Uncharacterized protein n=1 Tax=Olivibacter domesticus TaxID=407022 RepID=A0A1H7HKU9_OLID1|nr:hypothetical protein [Olivibacter domesticus]SEK51033.1 hypothetical protein SAMN05661044_00414 [Olivibacter domesticus]
METIFPFVIAALYFAFQIYSNFKKEQEKAKKRDPSQRPVGEQSPTYKEKRDWDKALQQKEVVLSETPKISKYEDFTGLVEEVEEVRRSKEVHRSHKHNNRSFEPNLQPMEENPYSDFDLRDAVIKAAILERPYK